MKHRPATAAERLLPAGRSSDHCRLGSSPSLIAPTKRKPRLGSVRMRRWFSPRVADGATRRADAGAQRRLRNDPALPDGVDQLVLADNPIAVADQEKQAGRTPAARSRTACPLRRSSCRPRSISNSPNRKSKVRLYQNRFAFPGSMGPATDAAPERGRIALRKSSENLQTSQRPAQASLKHVTRSVPETRPMMAVDTTSGRSTARL